VRPSATLAAAAVVAAALALSGVALIGLVHGSLVDNLDAANYARARDVASLASAGRLQRVVASTGEESAVVQVLDRSGTVVSASPNVIGESPVLARPPASRTRVSVTASGLPIGSAGESFRIAAQPVTLSDGPGWIYVATSLRQVNLALDRLRTLLVIGLPLLLAVVAAAIWAAVGRALRPVEQIRKRAATIGASDLQERVPVPSSHDEIERLAVTMNQMLGRLEDSAQRQRRFIGDASHELRSPLSAMRAQVDVALTHPEATDRHDVLSTVQHHTERMTQLIDDLLFLARADEAGLTSTTETVDLDELVLAEVHRLRAHGSVRIELVATDAARAAGSRRDLTRLLRNLGDNALAHARTTVAIGLSATDRDATISVSDDGSGVPPEERLRIFLRFARMDDARARLRGGAGAGLGLSIARQIVDAHGGEISVDESPQFGHGARFLVRLPLKGRANVRQTS
jgi:signal transduction histidine kinase